jgi:hypothetical protein
MVIDSSALEVRAEKRQAIQIEDILYEFTRLRNNEAIVPSEVTFSDSP